MKSERVVRRFAAVLAAAVSLSAILLLLIASAVFAGTTLSATADVTSGWSMIYNWTIDKSADQSELALTTGQQFLVNYSILIDATYTEDAWVEGDVCVTNGGAEATENLAIEAVLSDVSEGPPGDVLATVAIDVSAIPVLNPGETGCYTYHIEIPRSGEPSPQPHAGATYQITANVTIINHSGHIGTPFGPSPKASTLFPSVPVDVDECATVVDSYAGSLGVVCYGMDPLPKTYLYSRYIGPFETCGDYTVQNTASITTNDTGVISTDSWTVTVLVPCAEGCTLTPGYWKTHSEFGPAPYDDTWGQLAGGALTPFFLSGQGWYHVLWTPPSRGNAYYILAHQYIAVKLNILKGAASTPGVDAELAWADAEFFSIYTPSSSLTKSVRARAIACAEVLDQYNEGYIGPGHCSEDEYSVASDQVFDSESQSAGSDGATPRVFALAQNYPNPVGRSTVFAFDLQTGGAADLAVYSATGQRVATVVEGVLNAGSYTCVWDVPETLVPGVYFYKLQTAGSSCMRKLVLQK
jgi:hypothetical protein